MIVRNSMSPYSDNYDFGLSVSYKVGWRSQARRDGGHKVCLIALSDGMITSYESEQALVDHLNNDKFGFRPMTSDEIRNFLGAQGNRFPATTTGKYE